MKSFKVLSIETKPDGKVFVRGVYGVPPLPDGQTHEFEFENKQAIRDGIVATEERLSELDLCHLCLSAAAKSDPALGKATLDSTIGKSATVDFTGATTAVQIK